MVSQKKYANVRCSIYFGKNTGTIEPNPQRINAINISAANDVNVTRIMADGNQIFSGQQRISAGANDVVYANAESAYQLDIDFRAPCINACI